MWRHRMKKPGGVQARGAKGGRSLFRRRRKGQTREQAKGETARGKRGSALAREERLGGYYQRGPVMVHLSGEENGKVKKTMAERLKLLSEWKEAFNFPWQRDQEKKSAGGK